MFHLGGLSDISFCVEKAPAHDTNLSPKLAVRALRATRHSVRKKGATITAIAESHEM